MELLIGLLLAVVLLYFWLTGAWFARILMFLVVGAAVGFVAGALIEAPHPAHPGEFNTIAALIVWAIMWPVSGIPTYVRRQARSH